MSEKIKILLVEDNAYDVDLIREMLNTENGTTFDLKRVDRLSAGLSKLDREHFDLVLLDLSLPDSRGFDTFAKTHHHVPQKPIIVLTGLDDKALAVETVRKGAQDYLIKGEVNGTLLTRSMRYAIERKYAEEERRSRIRRIQRQQRAIVKLATHKTIANGDFARAVQIIAETSARAINVERVTIWMLNEERTELHQVAFHSRSSASPDTNQVVCLDDYPRYYQELRKSRVIEANDAQTDPRTRELCESYLAPLGITSMLDAPIRVSGQVVGDICYEHTAQPRTWYTDEITFAGEVADQVAHALQNAKRRRTEEALQQRTDQLEALREMTLAITGELELDKLLHAIVSKAVELVEGTAGGLNVYQPEDEVLDFAIHTGLDAVPEDTTLQKGAGVAGTVWKTNETLIIDNYEKWEGHAKPWHAYLQQMADIGVPIRWRDDFLGVLEVMAAHPRKFSSDDAEILSLFAAQAAIAIENARLFESQRKRTKEIEGLADVVRSISSTLNLDQVLASIAMQATQLSHSDAGIVFELNEEKQTLHTAASHNVSQDLIKQLNQTKIKVSGKSAIGRATKEQQPVQIVDTETETYPFRENTRIDDIRSLLAVPMIKGETVLGGIVLMRKEPGTFSSRDVDILATLADHAAVAVENAQLHRQLQSYADQLEERVRERTADLQAQHAQSRAILHSVTDGIVVTDDHGTIIRANPVAETWLTRTLSPEDAEQLSDAIRRLSQQADGQPEVVLELTGLDLALKAAPITEPGFARSAVVALHDVSHLKALDRMKSRFVSNVSHELRTPITTIKLHAQLMRRNPENWQEYLDILLKEVDHQAQLVKGILDISRVDAGRLEMDLQPTSLNTLVQEAVEGYQATAQKKNLTLKHHLPSHLPMALVDPQRMMQILNNLVTNAIRYTPQGGEIIVSTAVKQSEGRTWVTMTVEDNGIGIPEEELPHIFERFYRGDQPRMMQISGTGLGLAIVKEIVELHGGDVTVESNVDKGSSFTVWLPIGEQLANQEDSIHKGDQH